MIIIKDLKKHYGDQTVIDHFTYTFKEGKTYAITGPSGCGKTTLLNMIGLLEKPSEGYVEIEGYKNIKPSSMTATKIRRSVISYLFQNYALVQNESISYNLHLALHYVKDSNKSHLIEKAMKRVGVECSPKKKVCYLSGGQQQRIALARLFLKPAKVILCDEPTGNLDRKNADIVFEMLKGLSKERKIVIIVTHDEWLASQCDHHINLLDNTKN